MATPPSHENLHGIPARPPGPSHVNLHGTPFPPPGMPMPPPGASQVNFHGTPFPPPGMPIPPPGASHSNLQGMPFPPPGMPFPPPGMPFPPPPYDQNLQGMPIPPSLLFPPPPGPHLNFQHGMSVPPPPSHPNFRSLPGPLGRAPSHLNFQPGMPGPLSRTPSLGRTPSHLNFHPGMLGSLGRTNSHLNFQPGMPGPTPPPAHPMFQAMPVLSPPSNVPKEDVKSWYLGLFRGDCVILYTLLSKYPQLLNEGSKENPSRDATGIPLDAGSVKIVIMEHWMGCTVLHKAALRGSLKLLRKVLHTLFLPERSTKSADDSNRVEPEVPLRSVREFLLQKDGNCQLEALAIAVIHGNPSIIETLATAIHKCGSEKPDASLGSKGKPDHGQESTIKSGDDIIMWQEQLRKICQDAMKSLSSANREMIETDLGHMKSLDAERVFKYAFSDGDDWMDEHSESRDILLEEILQRINSRSDSEQLRRAVDALVNEGWSQSVEKQVDHAPLKEGSEIQVQGDAVEKRKLDPTEDAPTETALHDSEVIDLLAHLSCSELTDMIGILKSITQEVMMTGFNSDERLKIKLSYSGNLDFNFLPFDIYLFHFTFAQNDVERYLLQKIRQQISESIAKHQHARKIRKFLMHELQDGRGRTVIHVAVSNTTKTSPSKRNGESVSGWGNKSRSSHPPTSPTGNTKSQVASNSSSSKSRSFSPKLVWDFLKLCVSSAEVDSSRGTHASTNPADEKGDFVSEFLNVCLTAGSEDGETAESWLNKVDAVGRTPLYRAAAEGRELALKILLRQEQVLKKVKLSEFDLATYEDTLEQQTAVGKDLPKLYKRNDLGKLQLGRMLTPNFFDNAGSDADPHYLKEIADYRRESLMGSPRRSLDLQLVDLKVKITPLQIAIIHKHSACVKALIERQKIIIGQEFWQSLQLATLVGYPPTVTILLTHLKNHHDDTGSRSKEGEESKGTTPAILLAAASAKFELVRQLLDVGENIYDPFVTDEHGNTAMHLGVERKPVSFPFHLLHCTHVDRISIISYAQNADPRDEFSIIAERQGCIEMLLQAGLDPWDNNKERQPPNPSSDTLPVFLVWWYSKLATQTTEEQTTLNNAANAISITATLVATTSFVGPLQPPLSYLSDADTGYATALQAQIMSVRVFIVCDTLSFYLAVAAIMLAVIPFLPMLREGVRREILHSRKLVAFALGFLFPSIICIIMAFFASSIAVIPNDKKDGGLGLKISTCIIGASGCLMVIYLFFLRFLRLVFPANFRLKRIYGDPYFVYKLWGWLCKTSKRLVPEVKQDS